MRSASKSGPLAGPDRKGDRLKVTKLDNGTVIIDQPDPIVLAMIQIERYLDLEIRTGLRISSKINILAHARRLGEQCGYEPLAKAKTKRAALAALREMKAR